MINANFAIEIKQEDSKLEDSKLKAIIIKNHE